MKVSAPGADQKIKKEFVPPPPVKNDVIAPPDYSVLPPPSWEQVRKRELLAAKFGDQNVSKA